MFNPLFKIQPLFKLKALLQGSGEERESASAAPLHLAVKNEQVEEVAQLLQDGASIDVNGRDERGRTALHWAALSSDTPELIHILIRGGASPEVRDRRGRTPLHYAVEHCHVQAVQGLLECRARADAAFDGGTTALHLAARDGSKEIVGLLLAVRASPQGKPAHGRSPLMWAVVGGHVAVVNLLLRAGGDPSERYPAQDPEQGRSLLHVAVARGQRGIAEELLTAGADMDMKDGSGLSPLDYSEDVNTPNRDTIRLVLLSHSKNRVVAAGGSVVSTSQVVNLVTGTALGYLNMFSDLTVSAMFAREKESWWTLICLFSLSLPPIMHAILQYKRGFQRSAVYSLLLLELGHSTMESIRTKRKTPVYMAYKTLELAMESIPMAITQLYVLLIKWNEFQLSNLDIDSGVILVSITVSLLSIMHTAAMVALENEDSAWKGRLVGVGGMLLGLMYFIGDTCVHIGVFTVFAYTNRLYIVLVLALLILTSFLLTFKALGMRSASAMRTFFLAPLLTFVDFPLRPDKSTGLAPNWLWYRVMAVSFPTSAILLIVSLYAPLNYLPDLGHCKEEAGGAEGCSLSTRSEHGSLAPRLKIAFVACYAMKLIALVPILTAYVNEDSLWCVGGGGGGARSEGGAGGARRAGSPGMQELATMRDPARTDPPASAPAMYSTAPTPYFPSVGGKNSGSITTNPIFSNPMADHGNAIPE